MRIPEGKGKKKKAAIYKVMRTKNFKKLMINNHISGNEKGN